MKAQPHPADLFAADNEIPPPSPKQPSLPLLPSFTFICTSLLADSPLSFAVTVTTAMLPR